ncbi:hypothetical protein Hdeb2414_s0001g00016831 [Helianthus debilis subsp. tardiflorus]
MAAMVVGCLPGLILLFCCYLKFEYGFFPVYEVHSGFVFFESVLLTMSNKLWSGVQ